MFAKKLAVLALAGAFAFAVSPAQAEKEDQPGFAGQADLGATYTSGNTRTQSLSAKTDNKYRYDKNVVSMAARYLHTKEANTESARYWDAETRYARDISAWLAAYIGVKAESDPFAGYVQRDSADIGLRSVLTNEETFHWFLEAGFRTSKTHNMNDDVYNNFGRLYTEATKDFSKTTSARVWIEHLPNLTNSAAYLTNSEVSLTVVMTEMLSLKSSYLTKYQNAPPAGFEKTDGTFITALVAKY